MTEQEYIDITDLAKLDCALASLRSIFPGNKLIQEGMGVLQEREFELRKITEDIIYD